MADAKMSLSKVLEEIKNKKLTTIRFEQTDLHGISRSKLIPARHFEDKARGGLFFSLRHLGMDIQTDFVPGTGFNEEIGFGDALMFPDYETFRVLPWLKNTGRILLEPTLNGEFVSAHPRVIARRQLDKLKALGYSILMAHEYEFRVVDMTTRKPLATDASPKLTIGMTPYQDFVEHLMDVLPQLGVDVETVHRECAPGMIEITYKPAFGITAADNAHTYRITIKEIAFLHNLIASFMTKPNPEISGNSSHICHSLWDAEGKVPLLYDANSPSGLSKLGLHWVAGILAHAPAIQVLMAPTVNCIDGIQPCKWSANATWGIDNRTTVVRVRLNGDEGTYIENRAGASGSNPYLTLAATVAAGLDGIINELEPPPEVTGCAYVAEDVPPNTGVLPKNMEDALKALADDDVIRAAVGEDFIKTFTAVKKHEAKLMSDALAKGQTNWEMDYFFDIM